MKIDKHHTKLYASPKAVIALFLNLPGNDRVQHVIERIENLSEDEVNECMKKVTEDFGKRHRNIDEIFQDHFDRIENKILLSHFSSQRRLLLGAFLTKEYSIQAAALFNPSIVPHPDQQNLKVGEQRFIMSLRATGEGHISSIVFQTGIIDENGDIILDEAPRHFTCMHKNEDALYEKKFIHNCVDGIPDFHIEMLDMLPGSFTATEAKNIFKKISSPSQRLIDSIAVLEEIFDTNYELKDSSDIPINEKVILNPFNKSSNAIVTNPVAESDTA